jgi:beta-mannosidase
LWCGNNENHEMFDKGWDGRENNPPRFYGEVLYHETLPRVLTELDPSRPYLPSSPIGGEHPNDDGFGDQHYWDVWHGRGDWLHYRDSRARFCSEFGFASAPGPRTWARIAPDALTRDVQDPLARWHDKTLKGYGTFLDYVAQHYPRAENLEQWMYFSQLNQRDALRHGIEHFRRSEFCKGSLIWQLNDLWPAQSWAVLDFDGDYKAAAFELRRLYAPALASIEVEQDVARLWAISDNTRAPFFGVAELEVRSLDAGALLWRAERTMELSPGQRCVALECPLAGFDRARTVLWSRFAGHTSFRLLAEPKDSACTRAELEARWQGDTLCVESSGPVIDLFVWDASGAVQFRDNFLTLPHAGTLKLRADVARATAGRPMNLRARSLAGAYTL